MDRFVLVLGAALSSAATAAQHIDIVSEDQAPKTWTYDPGKPRVVAGYPVAAAGSGRDVCVNIGYLIRSDGTTSDFSRMKTWSSDGGKDVQAYVQAAAVAVSMSRFVPAATKAQPIYTSTTFAFDGSKALPAEDIRARCRIADLVGHVEQARLATSNRRWVFRRSEKLRPSDASAIEPFHQDY